MAAGVLLDHNFGVQRGGALWGFITYSGKFKIDDDSHFVASSTVLLSSSVLAALLYAYLFSSEIYPLVLGQFGGAAPLSAHITLVREAEVAPRVDSALSGTVILVDRDKDETEFLACGRDSVLSPIILQNHAIATIELRHWVRMDRETRLSNDSLLGCKPHANSSSGKPLLSGVDKSPVNAQRPMGQKDSLANQNIVRQDTTAERKKRLTR